VRYFTPPVSILTRLLAMTSALIWFPLEILRFGPIGAATLAVQEYRLQCGSGALKVIRERTNRDDFSTITISLLEMDSYEGLLVVVKADWELSRLRPFECVCWFGPEPPFLADEEDVAVWLGLPGLPVSAGRLRQRLLVSCLPGHLQSAVLDHIASVLTDEGLAHTSLQP
jgi:hypothetical protein